jgi:C4-dicarboxylate-specific signal transduction histidine kinase
MAPVVCDRVKLTQILVNLIANAEESLAQVETMERHLTLRTTINANDNVEIYVIDDGHGIAPEVRGRLFTYGFTTKKTGHGFGLHASALAAQEIGGMLRAHHDESDRGATFIVELPLSRRSEPISFAA